MNFYSSFLVMNLLCCTLANVATANLVPSVCKHLSQADPKNISYEFCISTLESDHRSSKSMAAQLAEISFQLGISRAKLITSTIDKLLKASTFDPPTRNALTECSTLYLGVPDDLEAGLKALTGGDFDTANAWVSSAMDAATTCGEGIKEKKGGISSLTKENKDIHQMGAISLGFTKLLRIVN